MPKIRSADEIAAKWARVTPGRSSDFEAGVRTPKEKWDERAAAAEPAFEAGVTEAIARKAYGKGVKEAGFTKWQGKTLAVGVGRWGPGVRAAEADYNTGFRPYRDVIERVVLPPRGPKGDPRNIDRVSTIAKALHDAKIK